MAGSKNKSAFCIIMSIFIIALANIFVSCESIGDAENADNREIAATTVTTEEEKGGIVLNILDYGATASDDGDDTVAFLDAFGDCPSEGTIRIPEGEYILSEPVACSSNSKIEGAGSGRTIIKYRGEDAADCVFRIESSSNVEISGITLDFEGRGSADRGILASNSDNVVISDVEIKNMGDEARPIGPIGVHFIGSTGGRISSCKFENIGAKTEWGCGIRLSHGSSNTLVDGNVIDQTGRGGILCDNNSTNLIIRNNTVGNCGLFSEGLGIELWGGCGYSIVEDNIIDHWLSIDSSDYSAIRRNIVSDTSGRIKYLGLELVNTSYFVFTDNTVDHGSYIGISESNVGPKNFGYWGYNEIKGCAQWGAQIQGEEGGSRYRYFYKTNFTGTYSDREPIYPGDAGHGIRINDNAWDFVFDSCEIKGNAGSAFQILGNNVGNIAFINGEIENNKSDSLPKTIDTETSIFSINIDCPDEAKVGEEIAFAVKSGDAEFEVKYILWDFGEGLPDSKASAKHTYGIPGSYRVTAIAWDDSGKAGMTEKYIMVTPD